MYFLNYMQQSEGILVIRNSNTGAFVFLYEYDLDSPELIITSPTKIIEFLQDCGFSTDYDSRNNSFSHMTPKQVIGDFNLYWLDA